MTLPRLRALDNYWHKFPPLHFLVAGFVGYKPKEIKVESKDDLGELMQIFGKGKVIG